MSPATTQTINDFEASFSRLHEFHDASAYEAIERLVKAGEVVGLDESALMRMLDRGLTFAQLLEVIGSKMEGLQRVA